MQNDYTFSKEFNKALSNLKTVIYDAITESDMPVQKDLKFYTGEGYELLTISYKVNKDVVAWHKKVWEYSKSQHVPNPDRKLDFISCKYPPDINAVDLINRIK